jgi:CBS-domain-containing membrane protein
MPQTVAEVMTRRVLTVPADCEVSQVARILLEADFRRVPVVTGRRLVGIVSRRDLVRVIATRDDTIESEIVRRLGQLGLGTSLGNIGVTAGVATIQLDDRGPDRRLAESVALTVPGVLEVRFANSIGR